MASDVEKPKLEPGTYRLREDVDNPDKDGRKRSDWRAVAWQPAGTVFVVDREGDGQRSWLTLRKTGRHQKIGPADDFFHALAAQLERVEEQPSDMLEREGWRGAAPWLLDILVRDGKITPEDVAAALRAYVREHE